MIPHYFTMSSNCVFCYCLDWERNYILCIEDEIWWLEGYLFYVLLRSSSMFFHHFLFYRLSVFLEPIDPARKKHPVNNLEVLTLSYKVSNVGVFAYISFRLFEAAMLIFTYFALWRFPGLLTLWSAPSVRRSTIKCFSSCCRSNGPNTVWTRSDSVVWAFIALLETTWSCEWNLPVMFLLWEIVCFCRFHGCHKEIGGSAGWRSEGQRAYKSADSPNVSAPSQTDALCQQPSQLHHHKGETSHETDLFTADSWICRVSPKQPKWIQPLLTVLLIYTCHNVYPHVCAYQYFQIKRIRSCVTSIGLLLKNHTSLSDLCPKHVLKLNNLHAILHVCFVSWQILHSTGLEFQHQVQEAKDLDQLIKIHYRYLATIHDRCLLREKVNSTAFRQLKWFSNITKETLPSSIKHFFIHITHL